ncbi:amidase [Siccirubricoccus deserti]|uniref:Acetamidase/formamidase family protein n=1 Tax=Siccirubricoccus deserti TaxID=2013562 RepID=A0A9X0R2I0_9PROT|nr:acetamidase/formamidase family protein [Siccirubricoccus deserti]MBC4018289.1 acetamidase/formamidase family protein [Siccirubricoccus deserti]GGC72496.1 amidase [Siccirubricoccus deserti]
MATHSLRATPETVRISAFDASFPPVLTIASGDTVEVECVSGREAVLPPPGSGMTVPPALAAIIAANPGMTAGHICTGPIAIAGAMPGDMLEIRIERIEPGADWGYNTIRPLAGTLPEDFHEPAMMIIPIDRARRTCRLPWGTELPLDPFFGVMGVAPPPAFGRIASKEPRIHGGNLDNKELQQGSTLFLPVHVPGANFSVGDGHGVQGDGEVCVTALETCLNGSLTFILHKSDGSAPLLKMPRAETPTHFISMGLHEDLDQAMKGALREMIAFIVARTNLSREQAYAFCSLAVDFHVTQTVNGEKGVHGLLKKGLLF